MGVVIDARQAFGSGAHATTFGCLELLCALEPPLSVLDIGCGSGVIAISAAKLGHRPVRACDIDPLSVTVAGANAAANGVEVETFVADADGRPAAPLRPLDREPARAARWPTSWRGPTRRRG